MPRVYIGRLSYNVREKDIQRFFSGYGRLLEIDLKNGYGFVEFEDSRDADDAVYELNGKELCGERVIVEHARGPRRDRDGYSYGSRMTNGAEAVSTEAKMTAFPDWPWLFHTLCDPCPMTLWLTLPEAMTTAAFCH
ncbi:serine/arginine-rich splicing factor 6 isoform X2 [Vulpes vulpes]|uniref:Serine/arginine-rich splicing factor 6 isoform X2 n=8 Tax=Laurasiatheria TaxID=314145 RepID=A0A8U0S814_MUSPF|nr:PREDICTED: serine/arginine-rich splicing factor 6 isoform X2 [Lipotes vexillifer]XP_022264660.1 serine/arginine-rich splicing factor 6 isoform X2 [Canis lupus familiaris]XP_026934080.1 serine/arginine-rich splicing factor 6 isoform X2 [Lagenorhynchus obliquidens]XP_030618773.1 serine/arginine-rich splicing factor 6 isoform X2 [Delphinapterus leucas]XP_030699446.1 serine/arginine-rich splicing factor 6 isoform X2 [Globicephala melas]XP_032206517.1 serine/arginine-rich splicing factor 6 isofo|eukprot:XP_005635134.1 serine/arginine-rich splicing factor 6 isoform X2 [Canis lupus familiaris]